MTENEKTPRWWRPRGLCVLELRHSELRQDFNAAEKLVMTHGEAPLEWAGSRRVSGYDELTTIRQGDGPDLQIWGSSTLYPGLIERGLLDRLTIITYPLVLGKGKRTFRRGSPPTTMRFRPISR